MYKGQVGIRFGILYILQQLNLKQIKFMFDDRVLIPQQLPVHQKDRKSTDVCCTVVGAIFALAMFITATCLWNPGNWNKLVATNYVDKNRKACTSGVAFASSPNADIQCVSSCPGGYDKTQYGFCLPLDPHQRELYLQKPAISQPWDCQGFRQTLKYAALLSVFFGIIWACFTQLVPRYAPLIACALAVLTLVIIGILLLFSNFSFWGITSWKIPIAIICFLLAIILIVIACFYQNQMRFQGLMLLYASRFIQQNPLVIVYVPIFLLLQIGLATLILWQHISFQSATKTQGESFCIFSFDGIEDVLNIIEFLWGLQFLRDAFNYCVSGYAVQWYWRKNQKGSCYNVFKRLITKNWGSVVGGSLLNAFFSLPTMITELIVCHPDTCCSSAGQMCHSKLNFVSCLCNLVRTDAYSYINLSGIPFCNSARQCERVCSRSNQFIGVHSPMRHYRLIANVFCVSVVGLLAYFILQKRMFNFYLSNLIVGLVIIYSVVTYFVKLHGDIGEGLQTCVLCQHQLQVQYEYMQLILPSIRKQFRKRELEDGKC